MFDSATVHDNPAPVSGSAQRWVELARDALGRAARVEASELDADELRSVVLGLEELRCFTDAAEGHALAELDRRKVTDLCSGHATSRWLAHRAGIPSGVARRRLAVANTLSEVLPQVDAALGAGRIGFDHARVLADAVNERNVAALSPMLDDLIDASAGTVFSRWRANVTALAALLDEDGPHDPEADLARNTVTLSPSDGFMLIRGELCGEHALSVHDTLNAVADDLFQQYSKDRATCPELDIPNRATLVALALEEICRRALAVDRSSSRPPRPEATVIIHPTGATPTVDGSPAAVDATSAWFVHDLIGSVLPASALPTFLCDPVLHSALVDSLGLPLDMGRATRSPTATQRRALDVRDGGCVFPGCDCPPAWTDAHHLARWHADRGSTDLRNLVLLCRRHHRVAHRRGWTLQLDVDGWTTWTTPDGHTLEGQRHLHQRAGP